MAKAKAKWIFSMPGQHNAASNATASGSGTASAKTAAENEAQRVVLTTAEAKKFGLENFGNTCYANSVIQALYFCTPFRELVMQATDASVTAQVQAPASPVTLTSTASTPALAQTAPPSPMPFRRKPERKQSSTGQPHVPAVDDPHTPNGSSLSNGVILSPTQAIAPSSMPSLPIPPSAPTSIPINPPSLFSALRSLYVHISTHPLEKGTVQPRAFIEKLKEVNEIFRSTTMHQDAHEFLNFLLNRIVEEVEEERRALKEDDLSNSIATLSPTIVTTTTNSNSGTATQDATLVHKLFEGILTSETRCLTCETLSSRDESFLDLSIDIEQNSSVTACLRQFSASEMLCQKNKFFCDSCCDLQEAEKRMKIKKLPNVLALHLKRFKYQEDLRKYVKLAYRVAFPVELRLFNTVDDADDADRLYELFAIVVHIGNGPHHGHYVSIIKTLGSWLVFDDVNVYPIAESDIPKYFGDPAGASSNSGSAYVLYYQAKDIDLVGLGLRQEAEEASAVVGESASGTEEDVLVNGNDVLDDAPLLPPGLLVEDFEGSISSSEQPLPPVRDPAAQMTQTQINGHGGHAATMSPKASVTGLLHHMMRRTGSTSGPATTGRVEGRRSVVEHDPRPSNLVDEIKDTEAVNGSGPAVPVVDTKEVKEKKKEGKEKSGGGWFGKRKSFRLGDKDKDKDKDRERSAHPASPSEHASSAADASTSPSTPSSNWFKTSAHPPKDKTKRQVESTTVFDISPSHNRHSTAGSEHGHHFNFHLHRHEHPEHPNGSAVNGSEMTELPNDGATRSFKVIRPQTSAGLVTPPPALSMPPAVNGQESPISRTPSSATSSSAVPLPSQSTSHEPRELPLPPIRQERPQESADTPFPTRSGPRPLPPIPWAPEHQKSLSHLPTLNETRRRPSTAGHQPIPQSSPPPPVPSMAAYQRDLNRSTNGHADPTKGKSRDDGLVRHSMTVDDESRTDHAGPVGGVASSLGSTNSASSNFKRATRKLSLTAPMLGFGKRDKDRDKEKERERERQRDVDYRAREHEKDRQKDILPPSSFPQFTGMTPRF
ncbi:hypothetical protein HGRIS_008536 [Hohenbuehelia grisea]|uniref:ubiquitinyl hydrolase 1 n=1 Tax=Hohenbuehelia grisea TaxID=104357 RepID=A0ABR3J8J6_9AGAR